MNRLTLVLVVLISGAAFAAGSGEVKTGWDAWSTNVYHLINLVILLALIAKFAGPNIKNGLKSRAERVGREIDEAAALHAEAKEILAEYNEKLAGFEAQRIELLDEFKAMGAAERDRIIAAAKIDAERIRNEAKRVAENEAARAKAKLESEIVDRAVASAQSAIREQLNEDDHRRLVADYFGQLESSIRNAQ